MAITQDIELKWYQALFEEDCLAIMRLLNDHPSRLIIGMESEPSRKVEGRRRREGTGRTRSTWKGRTALHVGASRGCIELIIQVLGLCNFDHFAELNEVYHSECSVVQEFSFDKLSSFSHDEILPRVHCSLCGVTSIQLISRGYSARCPGCYRSWYYKDQFEKIEVGLYGLSGEDRRDLLHAKHGECGLNALAIAALSNNQAVMIFLLYGMQACDKGEVDAHVGEVDAYMVARAALDKLPKPDGDDQRKRLRQVMVRVAQKEPVELRLYYEHRDFNFLPPEEYLFHFSFATKSSGPSLDTDKWWKAIRWCEGELWRFVLELQDAQGRLPFHVAMDASHEGTFLKLVGKSDSPTQVTGSSEREVIICALKASDKLGRTGVHRAAAVGLPEALRFILEYDDENDGEVGQVAATWSNPLNALEDLGVPFPVELFSVAQDKDFPLQFPLPQSPIHVAIIHGNFNCAQLLIRKWSRTWSENCMAYMTVWGVKHWSLPEEKIVTMDGKRENVTIMEISSNKRIMPCRWVDRGSKNLRSYRYDINDHTMATENKWIWIEWHLVELACLVGAPEWFVGFLIDIFKVDLTKRREELLIVADSFHDWEEYKELKGFFPGDIVLKNLWHPLHLVASSGKYDLLNYFINDRKLTPFVEDFEGNSPLHHAMKVRELAFQTHLLDYVDFEHVHLFEQSPLRMAKKQILEDNPLAERKGCINLLLEAGCEVFKTNKSKQLPYPRGNLNDEKLLSWWYTKKQEEFKAQHNDLNFATNAIAVTATLVATASYVGPLTPPMGFDANQIQYENVWVSIFIVCDTLSFYLAIVAITFSLIPSLPMPRQAMLEELQRTRQMVIWAVGILLPSIFFVFVAFASSSISVMSANITSEAGGILTIISTIVGVILCFLAFTLFGIRLWAFVYPRNTFIRYIYDLSNYVTKVSE